MTNDTECACQTIDTLASQSLRLVSDGMSARTDDMVLRGEYARRIVAESPCTCTVLEIMNRYAKPRYRSAL